MELTTLSGRIFCGASWADIDIDVIGISKEQCLEYFLKECATIKLGRTSTKVHYEDIEQDIKDYPNSHPEINPNSMWVNVDFELFKENPEKYIDLDWGVQTLPIVKVKSV